MRSLQEHLRGVKAEEDKAPAEPSATPVQTPTQSTAPKVTSQNQARAALDALKTRRAKAASVASAGVASAPAWEEIPAADEPDLSGATAAELPDELAQAHEDIPWDDAAIEAPADDDDGEYVFEEEIPGDEQ